MATLLERLPLPDRRGEIVGACVGLLEAEVGRKSGMSGLAVKAGYKMLKTFKPGVVPNMVDALLDEFIEALEVFHQDYQQPGSSGTFGEFIKARDSRVAEALVQVTDRRAEKSRHGSLKKGYQRLRGSAKRNVQEAVPGLAQLLDGYYRQ